MGKLLFKILLGLIFFCNLRRDFGEVAEWFKAHAWKACVPETVSRVRIPLSPLTQEIINK